MNSAAESPNAYKEMVHKLLVQQNMSVNAPTKKRRRFSKNVSQHDLELAVTVLLVDLASADQDFDAREYEVIVHGLMRLFGTSKTEISALINQAETVLKNLRGISRFGNLLKEHLPYEEREVIMDIIEEVIHADGVVDDYEIYLRHKMKGLLGMDEKPTT